MALFKTKTGEDKPKATKKAAPKADSAKTDKKTSMKELYGDKDTAKTPAKAGEKLIPKRGDAYRILLKPLVTEKAARESVEGKYSFEVAPKANKIEIMGAISDVYGIKPTAVNIVTMRGKRVRYGRIAGQRKDWKKAIVTLPKGKTINIYEGV
jgi:large subunit ribosomal protein L23